MPNKVTRSRSLRGGGALSSEELEKITTTAKRQESEVSASESVVAECVPEPTSAQVLMSEFAKSEDILDRRRLIKPA